MSRPVWITPGGNLGIFPELEFYSLPLEVNNPTSTPVTFSFLSGELPPGLQVVRSGILQGVPVVLDPIESDETRTYKFTIRASCQVPVVVVDRTFSFTVSAIKPPVIIPEQTMLGEFFDGTLVHIQLHAIEPNPNATLTWSLKGGELPPNISLSVTGLLTGFVGQTEPTLFADRIGYDAQPTQVPVNFTITSNVSLPLGETQRIESQEPFGDPQKYEEAGFPYDFTTDASINKNYTFTVQVYDGANYDTQTYTLKVIAKSAWTTDNDINTVNDTFITTDADEKYIPIITTTATIPSTRQNSNIAFKFDAVDFYDSVLTWDSNISSILPQVTINSSTGWMSGHIGLQTEYQHTYTFYVTAANVYTDSNSVVTSYTSKPVVYQLTVLGDINNQIIWKSPENLGSIINGAVSEFAVQTEFKGNTNITSDVNVVYKLVHGTLVTGSSAIGGPPITDANADPVYDYGTSTTVGLPQGLKLLPSGHIVGRASFRHFQLDTDGTTIDGKTTTFDSTYTFTVEAQAINSETDTILVSSTKTFTVNVDNLYAKPYENLYMKAFTTLEERRLFRDILADSSMFNDDLIYRLDDANFGKATEIRFLDLPGIDPSNLSDYADAMTKNHYTKNIDFSSIKTAIATDPNNNYAVKYEVVYVDIVDPFNPSNLDVRLETNLLNGANNKITTPYYDVTGAAHSLLAPNTFDNMQTRIETALGYSAQGVIPDWMTSVQEDKTVLGFKRALVLAYTKPGESKKIAYRIKNRGIDLNIISFSADRYVVDNSLSDNFDIAVQAFKPSRETTFDYLMLATPAAYDIVDYAATAPFASINNQSYEYLTANNGIDGVKTYRDGDRLIFAKQENFNSSYYADGWVYYTDLYLGNFTNDTNTEGQFDEGLYDSSYLVPGYVERNSNAKEPALMDNAAGGAIYLYVPYISGIDYTNKLVRYNAFIEYNTKVIAQQVDNSLGSLAWKLTLDTATTAAAVTGDVIKIEPYLTVTAVTNNTITVNTGDLPVSVTDRLALFGQELAGPGIPSGTVIVSIDGNVLIVDNPTNSPISTEVNDLVGYSVINQRAGIWEIRIGADNLIRLEFVKALSAGSIVKVLGGASHGASFLQYSNTIPDGSTVPVFVKVPNSVTTNSANNGRTTFDGHGTKFLDFRDLPATYDYRITDWVPNIGYSVGSIVRRNNRYYRAVTNITAYSTFMPTLVQYSGGARPTVETKQWELIDILPTVGDKYIKFPQLGVFN